jgi:xylulokinase
MTPANLARAAVEGLLCGLADGIDALRACGVPIERAFLVGGGARSAAVRQIAASVLGLPVLVPPADEYVAIGAARQAAWALSRAAEPPGWSVGSAGRQTIRHEADILPAVRERYSDARRLTLSRRRP